VNTTEPRFPTTDWLMLERAAKEPPAGRRLSLDQLLRRYLPVMRQYLQMRRRVPADQVDDLLQNFVTDRLMGDGLLQRADRSRGKFRSLLLRSLINYQIDVHRHQQMLDAHLHAVPLSDNTAAPANGDSDPTIHFDRMWAEQAINEALERTRQRLIATNRAAVWEVLSRRMLDPTSTEPYETLAPLLGFGSWVRASSALGTAKRVFARKLRDVLSEYAGEHADLAEEIRDLKIIFERSRAE